MMLMAYKSHFVICMQTYLSIWLVWAVFCSPLSPNGPHFGPRRWAKVMELQLRWRQLAGTFSEFWRHRWICRIQKRYPSHCFSGRRKLEGAAASRLRVPMLITSNPHSMLRFECNKTRKRQMTLLWLYSICFISRTVISGRVLPLVSAFFLFGNFCSETTHACLTPHS